MWWLNLSRIFDLVVQLLGNTNDEFDNVVEVKTKKKPPQRTPAILTRKEASEQKSNWVVDIEPSIKSTPSTRKLFQNWCPNRLRKLWRSQWTPSPFMRRRH